MPTNPYFYGLDDEQLNAYLRSVPGVGTPLRPFAPPNQAPFTRDDIRNEINRRNAIRNSNIPPEYQQDVIRGNYGAVPAEPGSNIPSEPVGLPLRARPGTPVSPFAGMDLPDNPVTPDATPPNGEQFGPPAPTRAPAGRGRSAGGRQALPVPPVPPGEGEQLGPTSRPDDPTAPPMSEKDKNTWLAVLQAGLGIMGGTSTNAAVNIGQGASSGVKAYQDWEKERRQDENRVRALDIQDQYRRDQGEYMRRMADAADNKNEIAGMLAQARAAQAGAGLTAREAALELRRQQIETQGQIQAFNANTAAERNDPLRAIHDDYMKTFRETTERLLTLKRRDITGEETPMYTPEEARARALTMVGPEPPRNIPRVERDQFAEVFNRYNAGTLGPNPEENERLWQVATQRMRQRYPGLRDVNSVIGGPRLQLRVP